MKLNYLTFGLVVLLGISSCSKDEDPTPDPITKANILGSVNLFDEGVTQIDNSNMTVSIDGTTFSVSTDVNGDFELTDIPFGSYTIVYEKSGYGTFKKFDIEHKNTGSSTVIMNTPSLGQKSSTSITNLTLSSSSNFPAIISATTEPEANNANPKYIRYFFSTDPSISSENYEYAIETFQVNNTPYNYNLSQEAIDVLGYTSGTTVYVKCYGESYYGNNYPDPSLAKDIFPNLNPNSASAVSFVVP
ncbi:carboxypeptidase-like regulatory domain-containing protein [uncultured Algibacter sp.]|uniref:carboxypeptidase-like regulatory domain-containing protein n=1 Tax=uncultured Algibacter sp. TaxID=298659 RepID=UPI002630585A|nr:carboxypeptidase-like regulatory domain-containing protein [uncultured Algibacter sp.]